MTEKTKEIVHQYWNSWQNKDLESLEKVCDKHMICHAGFFTFNNLEELKNEVVKGPAWKNVTMIDEVYTENKAGIIYEGINSLNEKTMRVSEIITLKNEKIIKVHSTICQL